MSLYNLSSVVLENVKNESLPCISKLGDFIEVTNEKDIPDFTLLAVSITKNNTNVWHYGIYTMKSFKPVFDFNFTGLRMISLNEFGGNNMNYKKRISISHHRNKSKIYMLNQKRKDYFLFDGLFRKCCSKIESNYRIKKLFDILPKYNLIETNCLTISLYIKQEDFDPFSFSKELKGELVYYTRILPSVVEEEGVKFFGVYIYRIVKNVLDYFFW